MDQQTIAAALLHDVVEDTVVTSEEVAERFGDEIARLVDGVTKLTRIPYQTKEDAQVENLRKMFLAMAKDIRVIIIKLADRLHNMRTLASLPPAKQQAIARETLEIYAPIAHRLGIWQIKWDLEDLALRYLDPEAYRDIAERVAKKRASAKPPLRGDRALRDEFKELEDQRRNPRPPEALLLDLHEDQKGRDFSTIYDLTAVRIIVDSVKDCYGALGVVHSIWKPLPGRFKDYIAMPKPNMYQSLHTTVVGPGGDPLEMQIRTSRCTGPANTASRRTGVTKKAARTTVRAEAHLAALAARVAERHARLAHVHGEPQARSVRDAGVHLLAEGRRVLARRPTATPLDFAYQVHTDVGNHCVGAKVNGKIVPLDFSCRTATSARCSSTNRARGRRWTGSRSSRRRARSTRSSSGSARSAAKRTWSPARRCSNRSWPGPGCAPTSPAAS